MATIFGNKHDEQFEAKRAVAEWVWENVIRSDRNPRLIIDAGSSAQAVAEVIADHVGDGGDEADFAWMTVLTHNLGAWEVLSPQRHGLDLFLVDGRYDSRLNANIPQGTLDETLGDFNPSVVVVAASGLDADGLYCSAVQDERPVKAALTARKTATRVIVADHTKIGLTDVRRFASLEELKNDARRTLIVTDEVNVKKLSDGQAAEYQTALNRFRHALGKNNVILVSTKGVEKKQPESQPQRVATVDEALPQQREAM